MYSLNCPKKLLEVIAFGWEVLNEYKWSSLLFQCGLHSGLHIIIFDEIDAICKSRGSVVCIALLYEKIPQKSYLYHFKSQRHVWNTSAFLHLFYFILKQAGNTGVHDTVVNQLLSKIDGVNQLNNILVIGTTPYTKTKSS